MHRLLNQIEDEVKEKQNSIKEEEKAENTGYVPLKPLPAEEEPEKKAPAASKTKAKAKLDIAVDDDDE